MSGGLRAKPLYVPCPGFASYAVGSAERLSQRVVRANPLIVGNEKAVPNITHVFRRSQNLYVNFDVYDWRRSALGRARGHLWQYWSW